MKIVKMYICDFLVAARFEFDHFGSETIVFDFDEFGWIIMVFMIIIFIIIVFYTFDKNDFFDFFESVECVFIPLSVRVCSFKIFFSDFKMRIF